MLNRADLQAPAVPDWVADMLKRRTEVESELRRAAAGKRDLPTAEECRALANKLAVPREFGGRVEVPSTTSDRTTDPSLADVVARLREPVDWAHFVSDDHALDYQAEREEAADLITALQTRAETAEQERDETTRQMMCGDEVLRQMRRAEKAEAEAAALREALTFYRDGFAPRIGKPLPGASGITFHPAEALLEDCGNRALAALANKETENV